MQKLTAIILSSRDVGEYDRLYTVYSLENGLVRAMGRGVRKPSAKLVGHLEPGTLSEIYVARSRGMGQITSAITLESFARLKGNFETLSEVLKIFRFFLGNFSEGGKDEKIFELLNDFLSGLDGRPDKEERKILTEAFWWKLFDALGNRPETMRCVVCGGAVGAEERKFFSVARGGIVSGKCAIAERGLSEISADQIKLLRVFLANSLKRVLKVKVGENELKRLSGIREEFRKYNF
jgi:DNA repair protein RecO (recombination protein O)